MTGLFSSQDDAKEFKYADGKLTFTFSMRGESTDVVMEQVSKEMGLLVELKSGEGKSVDRSTVDIKDLVLADSCYNISNGYVHYTIAVNNPNTEYAPRFINVNVSGRTADGKISFTDDWMISNTLPESTTYWSSQAGNDNVAESDTIEIKLSVDDDNWYKTSQKYNFYQIDNVNTSTDSLGYLIATGEITLKEDVRIGKSDDAKEPSLQCVLKDANGKLVGGFNTYVNNELKVGEPTPFEIRDHSLPKDLAYATVEVYANPWM